MNLNDARLLVVGAGLMGAGIAQVAAQAGHAVTLHDNRAGAAAAAKDKLAQTLDGLVAKGRLSADAAAATLARITPVDALAGGVDLVVEAVVENLDFIGLSVTIAVAQHAHGAVALGEEDVAVGRDLDVARAFQPVGEDVDLESSGHARHRVRGTLNVVGRIGRAGR